MVHGGVQTTKRLGMLAKQMSMIGSYLWIQPIMLNCSASTPIHIQSLNKHAYSFCSLAQLPTKIYRFIWKHDCSLSAQWALVFDFKMAYPIRSKNVNQTRKRVHWTQWAVLLDALIACDILLQFHLSYRVHSVSRMMRMMHYLGPVVPLFGKFYLWDKSGNPRMWLGNLIATYPIGKIY